MRYRRTRCGIRVTFYESLTLAAPRVENSLQTDANVDFWQQLRVFIHTILFGLVEQQLCNTCLTFVTTGGDSKTPVRERWFVNADSKGWSMVGRL